MERPPEGQQEQIAKRPTLGRVPLGRRNTARDRVGVLVDTPNLFRSTQQLYGSRTYPDYAQIYRAARGFGEIRKATAFVNDGVAPKFTRLLDSLGFSVAYSHAADVDDALTAQAVAFHYWADHIVLCSGDSDYIPVVELLKSLKGISVTICAVRQHCSRHLRQLADGYVEVPRFEVAAY